MTAVSDLLGRLTPKGVNYISTEEATLLMQAGVVAGKETLLELPLETGIRVLCYVTLHVGYTKVWIRQRRYRAEVGNFALEASSLADARPLYKQVEEMHYRDMLAEIN